MLSEVIRSEIRQLLADQLLPDTELEEADGFANLVVSTPNHVIRLNSGRFPNASRHEATVLGALPSEIPRPEVVAYGQRSAGGEYLILERLPGIHLEHAWTELAASDRIATLEELGDILKRLHALPIRSWMENPWIKDAVAANRWCDAYHANPTIYPSLIASATRRRPDLTLLLLAVSDFISARMHAFDDDIEAFIHTDLHFRNVVVDGARISGLVDFEGSRIGPRDAELDMLVRSLRPNTPGIETRFPGAIQTLRRVYPDLFSSDHLLEKIEVQEGVWHLVQLHNWSFGQTWTTDPAESLCALVSGEFSERTRRLLH